MKKANKLLACLGVALLAVPAMTACGTNKSESSNTDTIELDGVDKQIHDIYLLAKESGFKGSYEEWLATIKGADGIGIAKIEQLDDDAEGNSRYKLTLTNGETKEFTIKKGDKGDPGQPGEPGQPGKDGADGSTITTGVGVPKADSGKVNDLYIDSATWDLYSKTSEGWEKVGNIKGQDGGSGTAGTPGKDGADGTSMLTGKGQPKADVGKLGDVYLDEDSFDIYKKGENGWKKFGNIKGQAGGDANPGEPGQDGNNGESAYDLFKKNFGYVGSEVDWLKDLATQHLGFEKEYTLSIVYLNGEYDDHREKEHPIVENKVYQNGEKVEVTLPELEDKSLKFALASDEYSFKGIDDVDSIDINDYRAYKNCTIYLYYRHLNYNVRYDNYNPNYLDGLPIKIYQCFDGLVEEEVSNEVYQNLQMDVISCSDPSANVAYDKASKTITTDKPCFVEVAFNYNDEMICNLTFEFIKVSNIVKFNINPKTMQQLKQIPANSSFGIMGECIDDESNTLTFSEAMNNGSIQTVFTLKSNEEVRWDSKTFIMPNPTTGTIKILNANDKSVLFEKEIAIVDKPGGGESVEGPVSLSPQTLKFLDNASVGDKIRLNGFYTLKDGNKLKIYEAIKSGMLFISVKDEKIAHLEKDMLVIDGDGENVLIFMNKDKNVLYEVPYKVSSTPELSKHFEITLDGDPLQIKVGQAITFNVTSEGVYVDPNTLNFMLEEPTQDQSGNYGVNASLKTLTITKCGYYMFYASNESGYGRIFVQVINPNLKEPSATFTCVNQDVEPQIISCDMTKESKFVNEKEVKLGEKVEGNHYMRISAKVPEGKEIVGVTVDGTQIPFTKTQGAFYYLSDGNAHVIEFILDDVNVEEPVSISRIEVNKDSIEKAKYCRVGSPLLLAITVYDGNGNVLDLLKVSSLIITTMDGVPYKMDVSSKGYRFIGNEPGNFTISFVDPVSGIPFAQVAVTVSK